MDYESDTSFSYQLRNMNLTGPMQNSEKCSLQDHHALETLQDIHPNKKLTANQNNQNVNHYKATPHPSTKDTCNWQKIKHSKTIETQYCQFATHYRTISR